MKLSKGGKVRCDMSTSVRILWWWVTETQFTEVRTEIRASKRHSGKDSACYCRRRKRSVFDPWVGKISWRRKWQPTQVFLPGEFHGQRSPRAIVYGVTKNQTRWARTASRGQKLALGTMSAPTPPPPQLLGIASQPSLSSWVHELPSFLHARDRAASPWVSYHAVPATRNTFPLSCLSDCNVLNPPPPKGSNLA